METAAARPHVLANHRHLFADRGAIAAWVLAFALIVYLGFNSGGYDTIVRSEVGLVVWWGVLIGCAVGLVPGARIGRLGWTAVGLLAAFAAWTALGIGWSQSAERSATELGRVAMYLGVFVLALSLRTGGRGRIVVNAVGSGIACVSVLALLSRLHPAWFPDNVTAVLLPGARPRLSYPLDSWNGLAALVALGIPLVLYAATSARTLAGQALGAAALPAMALCAYFTVSRGGAVATAIGLLTFFALAQERLRLLAGTLVAGAGSAILIAAATTRGDLGDGLATATAHSQGNAMLLMMVLVCGGAAALQIAIRLALRRRPGLLRVSIPPAHRWAVGLATVVVVVTATLAAGVPHRLSQDWDKFKNPGVGLKAGQHNQARFSSVSGNGRYQFWNAAIDATRSEPWHGIGPGAYEFWWARHGSLASFVRNAHSLYMETLAEVGIVGLALLAVFLALILISGFMRATRDRANRLTIAAAAAGAASFCASAAFEWVWQLAVLPVAFLLLAGVLIADPTVEGGRTRTQAIAPRLLLGGLALLSLVAIALPLAGASQLHASRADANAGRLDKALREARRAQSVQPYAASPRMQQALVLERANRLADAASAARAATEKEPTNWRTWVVLSRIELERHHVRAAVDAYRRAKSLNPRSLLFPS